MLDASCAAGTGRGVYGSGNGNNELTSSPNADHSPNSRRDAGNGTGRKADFAAAIERAKEAGKRERNLSRQREASGLGDHQSVELTYSVCFNLAYQYENANMLTEV